MDGRSIQRREPSDGSLVARTPHPEAIDADVSVTLPISQHFDTVRIVVEHLAAQTIAGRLEIVFLAENDRIAVDESALVAFAGWQLAVPADFDSAGHLRAEGVRLARAPRVWFAEDHGFPGPGTLEALLRAFDRGHTVPGVVMENANPATSISWADLFLNFGPYIGRREVEDLGHLAWHKSMYPREFLLEHGADLDDLLDVEVELQQHAAAHGFRLTIVPDAPLYHLNISRLGVLVQAQAINGRLYGASRAVDWPLWKRFAYVAAYPLLVAVRLGRVMAEVIRAGEAKRLPAMFPFLVIGLGVNQFGEALGYVAGHGASRMRKLDGEYRRYRYMSETDRRRVFGDSSEAPWSLVASWTIPR